MTQLTIDDILTRGQGLLTPENLDDPRIDPAAQESISRLNQGETLDQICALALLSGVKAEAGGLMGIFGDDSSDAAELASLLDTDPSTLVPSGADAVLVSGPDSSTPAIVFRAEARNDPIRLDNSLPGVIRDSRTVLSDAADLGLVGDPADPKPWLCTWICGMCALALADGVPFDEVPVCLACLTCITGSG
ncbi:hypothetical protein ACGF07_21440 [Kitasatospora sp. NPDC048194]|uniref:hypothetical protein n=1 Tax=Kitasatospora sp. NPDC048194 TaxID=3364045 RepID=UPI003710FFDB